VKTGAANRLPREAGQSSVRDFLTREDYDAYLKRLETGVPLGMAGREEVEGLVATVRQGLAAGGATKARVALRGSAVTGRKFDDKAGTYSGRPFDGDPTDPSDYDLAIVSPEFLEKAKELEVPLAQGGRRTGVLREGDLKRLGLEQLVQGLKQHGDRDINVMIYGTFKSLRERGPAMWLDR